MENKLWYARFIRDILNACDDLEKAGGALMNAKNEVLFKEIHEMRMKLLTLSGNLIADDLDKKRF